MLRYTCMYNFLYSGKSANSLYRFFPAITQPMHPTRSYPHWYSSHVSIFSEFIYPQISLCVQSMIGFTIIFFCCIHSSLIRLRASLSSISIIFVNFSFSFLVCQSFSNSSLFNLEVLSSHLTPVAIYRFAHPVSFSVEQQYLTNLVGGISFSGINLHMLINFPL